MTILKFSIFTLFSIFMLGSTPKDTTPKTLVGDPIAVVELFTSQGCAGCPSADLLLSKVVEESETSEKPIIGLSFHITYYNHLGWKDPYSDEMCDQRQHEYAKRFVYSHMYTPQMVINGTYEFAGASQIAIDNALFRALAKPARALVKASAKKHKHSIHLDYDVVGEGKDWVVNVALVDSHAENHVAQGANKDRRLSHRNVVRVFQTYTDMNQSNLVLNLPKDFDMERSFIAVYVQDHQTFEILGASKISMP